MLPNSALGGQLVAALVGALGAADIASQRRYAFRQAFVSMATAEARWSMSRAVDTLSGGAPELVLYHVLH
ncbi:MAG: hypothetical protein FJ029_09305 [Actinobacteria bacterium]|nr:hypothetical protein [Actinomycetota bacterium]